MLLFYPLRDKKTTDFGYNRITVLKPSNEIDYSFVNIREPLL